MELTHVSVRLRRIRTEAAQVSVPITPDLVVRDDHDSGALRIDTEKLFEAALKLGIEDATGWSLDGDVVVDLHPIQEPPR